MQKYFLAKVQEWLDRQWRKRHFRVVLVLWAPCFVVAVVALHRTLAPAEPSSGLLAVAGLSLAVCMLAIFGVVDLVLSLIGRRP